MTVLFSSRQNKNSNIVVVQGFFSIFRSFSVKIGHPAKTSVTLYTAKEASNADSEISEMRPRVHPGLRAACMV